MKSIDLRFAAILLTVLIAGCDAACENEVASSVTSPSGALKAVVFHRACGASVGFNTQVSVIEASAALPDGGGNVLILDGKREPKIQWTSDGRLSISAVFSTAVFKKEQLVAGVAILYE